MVGNVVDALINNDVIDRDDRELYEYGLEQGILMLINLFTTIIIGICFGMVIESIVFMLAYIPLRTYAGGYHAKNQWRCYFFSIAMMIVALLGIKGIDLFSIVSVVLIFISYVIIYTLSPVEDCNKLLNEKEKVIYKKKSRRILIIEFVVMLILMSFEQYVIASAIVIAQVSVGIMIVLGYKKEMSDDEVYR